MASILQSLTFGTNNKATLGPCPLGSVWTVLVSVPQATNSSSFEVYLQGTQLGSMQGTATFGPFQMRGNEVLTIVSTGAQVTAAQTVTVMGQADAERNAPTGIFPVVSGGVVTTTATYPLSTPQGAVLSANVALPTANTWEEVFSTPVLAVGTWLVTFTAVISAGICIIEITLGIGAGSISGVTTGEGQANTSITIVALVQITTAGTLVMNAQSTTANAAVLSNGSTLTGWSATRVA